MLAIGMSLATIISKQIVLSSIGKMSRVAYYAADSGRDCAFFWGVKYRDTVSGAINPTATPEIYCQGSTALSVDPVNEEGLVLRLLKMYGIDLSAEGGYSYFNFKQEINVLGGQNACNKFSVFIYPETSTSLYSAVIVSRGFSAPCDTLNSRTVGRSVINVVKKGA